MKHQTSEETEKNPLVLKAMHEIELAKARERKGAKDEDKIMVGYVDACYDSALRAYKSLCEDGHSGMSWSITCMILEKLMHEIPLTPITDDDPSEWTECTWRQSSYKTYQNARRGSLFKDVYPDGTVEYRDGDNDVLEEVNLKDLHVCGLGSHRTTIVLDHYFKEETKITMPYSPRRERWRVRLSEDLCTDKNGNDVNYLHYIKKPNGERVTYDKFIMFSKDGMVELYDETVEKMGIDIQHVREQMRKAAL